jgi:OB-fold nucleic acid binding domain
MAHDPAHKGFRKKLSRLVAPAERLEAEELAEQTVLEGATKVAELPARAKVTVCGTLRSVTLQPRAGVPALTAELYDGTGTLVLVWVGRRRIPGIEPGRSLRAEGRVSENYDKPVMFNPRYELKPAVE